MNRFEFVADLKFAAHRGLGTTISTWNHRPNEGRLLSGCVDGRYRVVLESVDENDLVPQHKVIPMLFRVLVLANNEVEIIEILADAALYVRGYGVDFLIDNHTVGFVPDLRFVGFTSREQEMEVTDV